MLMPSKYRVMALQKQTSQKYIYLADDDEDDRAVFADAIIKIDPAIVLKEACDGMLLMNALRSLSHTLPDIVFLDINMPGKNGLQCLEEIRTFDGALKNIKIIMLSTSDDPESIQMARELGASFYAVKPNRFDTLKSFLEDVLQMDWRFADKRQFRLI